MQPRLLLPPLPYPARYIIDPVAFFVALVGGPLLFTALSFWLVIPVFALFFGGPAYLLIGTPLLLWYLRHRDADASALAWLAAMVMLAGLALALIVGAVTRDEEILWVGLWFTGFGTIFGPLWAYFFGTLYTRMRRDFYAKPRSF